MSEVKGWSPAQKRAFFWVVLLIMPLSGMGTDLYVPSLPAIMVSLHTTHALVQWTIGMYMLGMGCSQLIAGPLADALGRRRLIIMGLCVNTLAVWLIIVTENIHWMLGLRLVQGIALSFCAVPARAILADIFTREEFQKNLIWLTVSWALGAIVSPFIGGYLQHAFGWHANFYFLMGFMLGLLFLTLFVLRETHVHKQSLQVKHVVASYWMIMNDGYFMLSFVSAGLVISLLILFNTVAPFLVQTVMHYGPIVYGRIALLMGFAWLLGTLLSRMTFRFSAHGKTAVALLILLLLALVMLGIEHRFGLQLWVLVVPTWFMVIAGGMIFPTLVSGALPRFPKHGGLANGLFFAGAWLVSSIVIGFGSLLKTHSIMPLALADTAVIGVTLICYFLQTRCCSKLSCEMRT